MTLLSSRAAEQSEQSEQDREPAEMAATRTQTMETLPSGLGICTTAPDILYLPELVSVGTIAEGRAADLEAHQELFNFSFFFSPFSSFAKILGFFFLRLKASFTIPIKLISKWVINL